MNRYQRIVSMATAAAVYSDNGRDGDCRTRGLYCLGSDHNQHINPEPDQLRHEARQPRDVTLRRAQQDAPSG